MASGKISSAVRISAFEHHLVRVGAGALADLDDERRLAVDAAAEQAHGLLQVVDVVRADGIFAVGQLKQFLGGDDHHDLASVRGIVSKGTSSYYSSFPADCKISSAPSRQPHVFRFMFSDATMCGRVRRPSCISEVSA